MFPAGPEWFRISHISHIWTGSRAREVQGAVNPHPQPGRVIDRLHHLGFGFTKQEEMEIPGLLAHSGRQCVRQFVAVGWLVPVAPDDETVMLLLTEVGRRMAPLRRSASLAARHAGSGAGWGIFVCIPLSFADSEQNSPEISPGVR